MNIQAISSTNYANHISRNNITSKKQETLHSQSQQPSFDGIWTRMSRSYIDKTSFAIRGYYPFIDGVSPTKTHDDSGRIIASLNDNGMTVDEGNKALEFILKGKATKENYEAAKKLNDFMKKTVDEYTPMFMEFEDKADETKATKKAHIKQYEVENLILDYEYRNGLRKRSEPKQEEVEEMLSPEEFLKKLMDDAIA